MTLMIAVNVDAAHPSVFIQRRALPHFLFRCVFRQCVQNVSDFQQLPNRKQWRRAEIFAPCQGPQFIRNSAKSQYAQTSSGRRDGAHSQRSFERHFNRRLRRWRESSWQIKSALLIAFQRVSFLPWRLVGSCLKTDSWCVFFKVGAAVSSRPGIMWDF